jgi:hypothetical protein
MPEPTIDHRLHEALPPLLRQWVTCQAEAMGLPGPDDYILLLLKLEKQRQDLETVPERYRRVFGSG